MKQLELDWVMRVDNGFENPQVFPIALACGQKRCHTVGHYFPLNNRIVIFLKRLN